MHILLTGGTGFVGRALAARCERVTVLTRDPVGASAVFPAARLVAWQPSREPPPAAAFEGVEAVVNLAGESIGRGRWTAERKRRLRDSRIVTTRRLVEAMSRLETPPKALVSASALGYYGDRGDEILAEDHAPGEGFLAELARDWEAAAEAARPLGVRVVRARIALVLGRGGDAVRRILGLFRLGLGGRLGGGRQWMSWIHLDDLVEILCFATREESLAGALNACAPEPVRNAEFTRLLARTLHRPALLPAPAFALRWVLGELAESLLDSVRMAPAVAERAGFRFRHPTLASALEEIVGPRAGG